MSYILMTFATCGTFHTVTRRWMLSLSLRSSASPLALLLVKATRASTAFFTCNGTTAAAAAGQARSAPRSPRQRSGSARPAPRSTWARSSRSFPLAMVPPVPRAAPAPACAAPSGARRGPSGAGGAHRGGAGARGASGGFRSAAVVSPGPVSRVCSQAVLPRQGHGLTGLGAPCRGPPVHPAPAPGPAGRRAGLLRLVATVSSR